MWFTFFGFTLYGIEVNFQLILQISNVLLVFDVETCKYFYDVYITVDEEH